MNKLFKRYAVILAIAFVAFNAIAFIVPNDALEGYAKFGGAFWSALICIDISFIGQLFCAKRAFRAENAKRLFYNVPVIKISYTGLAISLIAGIICMVIPELPNWIAIVIAIIVLAVTAISVIEADVSAEHAQATDEKTTADTGRLKKLRLAANSLPALTTDPQLKKQLENLVEEFKYSDPVSSEATAEIEAEISSDIEKLKELLKSENMSAAQAISNILVKLEERNRICKIDKK